LSPIWLFLSFLKKTPASKNIMTEVPPVVTSASQKKRIYRVLMVTGIYPTPQQPHSGTFIKPLVDSLRAAGHEVEIIHPRPGPAFLRYILATFQVFWKTLSGRYDLVHGHYGLWCLAARLQWRAKVVAAFLGDDLLGTLTATGSYSRKSLLVVGLSRWLGRVADATTVKSEQMKKASGCADAVVIADGIDFELFHPMPRAETRAVLGWEQDRYYVLFANNPQIPVKNFALAQKSLQRLAEQGIVAELVVANGLPQTMVVQYMNAANALILPSLAEGTPNVVKEAMACNVPVVATDVGDVAQVIGHTAGCTVCPPSADALAVGLTRAFLHTGPTTGRADIAHLRSSAILQHVLDLYAQALTGKKHI
jgi:glycosyltransferase involved in cell wall biosynthesis